MTISLPLRPAFALPEVLLAVLLFAVGILGLASTATFIAGQAGDARRLLEAANLAGVQLDSLRAMPCVDIRAGSASFRGAVFAWSVADTLQSRLIQGSVTDARPRRPRAYVFEALLPCER